MSALSHLNIVYLFLNLTVVYSQQQFDSLIPCCLTRPPPWIRGRSDTLNLACTTMFGDACSSRCSVLYMTIASITPRHL